MRRARKQSAPAQGERVLEPPEGVERQLEPKVRPSGSGESAGPGDPIGALYPFARDTKPIEWHRAQSRRVYEQAVQRVDEHLHFVLVEILAELRRMNEK